MITVENANGANSRSVPIERVLEKRERRAPSLANNLKYRALKAFLLSVRAAGGYRGFVIEQRRTCALMRHLAIRDRATTSDGVLKFLARTGEAGLFRRVMSYLPPPPRPKRTFSIRVRQPGNEAAHVAFKIHNTTRLRKVFEAYSTRQGISLAQLAFSLPASPEVLIEGTQTADDIGLEDDGVIDARPQPIEAVVL